MTTAQKTRHRGKNILFYADTERDADLRYATRFHAPDPFIFVRTASGRRHLVMSDLEIARARAQSSARVHALSHYTRLAKERYGNSAAMPAVVATFLETLRIRRVDVAERFPLGMADALRRYGIRVTSHHDPFFPERMRKRPDEIREIKKALRATEKGIKAALDTLRGSRIRKGYVIHKGKRLTAETLRAIIDTTVLGLGYIPTGTIVASGRQGCDPHERGSGPIRAHQPLIIDVFPHSEKSGYFGDITRTVVRGKASDYVKAMYRAVRNAQRTAIDMIRPGVKARAVHGAVTKIFEERGFQTGAIKGRMQGFFHGTGHGLGLEIHEPPRIGLNSTKLEKGMVVTVEPGLYYEPHGGIRIEDTVLVTARGVENLTRLPKVLEI